MGLMMTGAPEEEEMMTEEEGEEWMMGHVVVVMTPNPGSPWGDPVSLSPLAADGSTLKPNLELTFQFPMKHQLRLGEKQIQSTAQRLLKNVISMTLSRMLLLQVGGVSGRRPGRRAGVLPVVIAMMMEMTPKEGRDPATASETAVLRGVLGRPLQRR